MKLSDSGSMREYIKKVTETFDELAELISDEDKVIYLLAGLPESYDILVTALESGVDIVPPLESVTECLLREEQKLKDREEVDNSKKLLMANSLLATTARSLDTTAGSLHKHSLVRRMESTRIHHVTPKSSDSLRMPC